MKRATVIAACLLAGCVTAPRETEEQAVQRIVDQYTSECRLAGYKVGTEPFYDCVVVAFQRDKRATDAQKRAAANSFKIPQNAMVLPPPAPLRQPTNCQTTYIGNVASTTCY